MQHVAYLPYCVASLLLLNFLVYTRAAGLLSYGPEYGDTELDDPGDDKKKTIDLIRPVQFNGVYYPNLTVSSTYPKGATQDYFSGHFFVFLKLLFLLCCCYM